jgi:hypothetical protein
MPRTRAFIIGALILACGGSLGATGDVKGVPITDPRAERAAIWVREGSSRGSTTSAAPLRVENVRLEAAPGTETVPSAVLKFDVFNVSPKRQTDLLLEISITEKSAFKPVLAPRRVLVRPFKIRGNFVLEAGYTINYEMLLRHLSTDCDCVATVDVLSMRALPDSDQ